MISSHLKPMDSSKKIKRAHSHEEKERDFFINCPEIKSIPKNSRAFDFFSIDHSSGKLLVQGNEKNEICFTAIGANPRVVAKKRTTSVLGMLKVCSLPGDKVIYSSSVRNVNFADFSVKNPEFKPIETAMNLYYQMPAIFNQEIVGCFGVDGTSEFLFYEQDNYITPTVSLNLGPSRSDKFFPAVLPLRESDQSEELMVVCYGNGCLQLKKRNGKNFENIGIEKKLEHFTIHAELDCRGFQFNSIGKKHLLVTEIVEETASNPVTEEPIRYPVSQFLLKLQHGQLVKTHGFPPGHVLVGCFTYHGLDRFVTANYKDWVLTVWDPVVGKELSTFRSRLSMQKVQVWKDGTIAIENSHQGVQFLRYVPQKMLSDYLLTTVGIFRGAAAPLRNLIADYVFDDISINPRKHSF